LRGFQGFRSGIRADGPKYAGLLRMKFNFDLSSEWNSKVFECFFRKRRSPALVRLQSEFRSHDSIVAPLAQTWRKKLAEAYPWRAESGVRRAD
jgi:hypothetical protein